MSMLLIVLAVWSGSNGVFVVFRLHVTSDEKTRRKICENDLGSVRYARLLN